MFFLIILLFITSCSTGQNDNATVAERKYKTVVFCGIDTINLIPDTVYIGTMNEGETGLIQFAVENKSDKEIYISEIHSGCGCTTIECKNRYLKPKKKTIATLQYNSSGQFGKQLKTVSIISKDGERRQLILTADILY